MINLEEVQNLVDRVDTLIRLQATGTSYELSKKLRISRASVIRLLHSLRNQGAPILYCKYRKTYYYKKNVKIEIIFRIVTLG